MQWLQDALPEIFGPSLDASKNLQTSEMLNPVRHSEPLPPLPATTPLPAPLFPTLLDPQFQLRTSPPPVAPPHIKPLACPLTVPLDVPFAASLIDQNSTVVCVHLVQDQLRQFFEASADMFSLPGWCLSSFNAIQSNKMTSQRMFGLIGGRIGAPTWN